MTLRKISLQRTATKTAEKASARNQPLENKIKKETGLMNTIFNRRGL